MTVFLKKAVKIKIIRPLDFYFSQFISNENSILMLVAACISYENKNGHIFLPIEYFEKNCFFSTKNKKFIKQILNILNKKINWSKELLKHNSVGNGSNPTPIVLSKKKIYLYKMWKSKKNVLNFFNKKQKRNIINYKKYSQILNNLFPEKIKNTQKIAVALTLIKNITFITGGPGTGKTTTILKIIIALIKRTKKIIKIQLSAPTGKATTRLTEIIKNNIFDLYLSKKEKMSLPSSAVTIHQLLGLNKISQVSFFNKKNLLNVDVLIIDETSMIDLLLIEKIFDAVPKNIKLIFIGDENQLCPIEAGAILKNITYYFNNGYNYKTSLILEKLTKYTLSKKINTKNNNGINNNICVLKKNYRFDKNSGIYMLSKAICNQKINILEKLFKNNIKNVFFYEINSMKHYQTMVAKISLQYKNFWEKIQKKEPIKNIIETFQYYQTLSTLREGLFGSNILNEKIEIEMCRKYEIKYFYINNKIWYIGKPIIITSNNKTLDIFNGNIGIANMNDKGILQVSFLKENEIIINIPIKILKDYETAWVITVHKAQGSEFIDTSLILPNVDSHVLNKDILYTGITRSRKKLNIFSNKEIFTKTFSKNTNKNNLIEMSNF